MQNSALSALDWQLIELLQKDSRTTITELAKQLNRSRSTITEHLERMQDSGVIEGYGLRLDVEKMGFGLKAFVRLSAGSKEHRKVIEAISSLPEVVECHVLTGSELLILQVVATDMAHLRKFVDGLTAYGSTQTEVVFSTIKNELSVNQKLRALIDTPL